MSYFLVTGRVKASDFVLVAGVVSLLEGIVQISYGNIEVAIVRIFPLEDVDTVAYEFVVGVDGKLEFPVLGSIGDENLDESVGVSGMLCF